MRAVTLLAAMLALAACNEQQGQPADAGSLGSAMPREHLAEFDLAAEIPVATAACVASELQGPAALQSLRRQGYTALKELGTVKYVKIAPPGPGPLRAIKVSDQNDRLACRIEVQKNRAYTAMALMGAALEAQGYRRAGGSDSAPRFAKDDVTFVLSGGARLTDLLSTLEIRKL